ncbi:cocaine esterase-like [Branchiostoma lanceolatum]|uniref:cocaine esterase-like n=1 Tax=Branchiostoma lanceolatum TaxID=7740 RepID=UPI003456BAEC
MMACLRQKSADDIVAAHQRLAAKLSVEGILMPFTPSVDGVFLPAHPNVLLEKGQVNTGSYLLGVNNHEYGFHLPSATLPNFGQGMGHDTFLLMMKRLVRRLYPGSSEDGIVSVLRKEYLDNSKDPMATLYQFTHVYGDQMFVAPTVFVADKIGASGQVYLYENQYAPSFVRTARPDWVGCDHADDLLIMTGVAMLDRPLKDGGFMPFSEEDKNTSLDFMAYWANFARTGNPSDCTGGPADSPTVPEWPQYTPDNPAYMKLDLTSSADVGFHPDRMALWNDVIPKLAASSER